MIRLWAVIVIAALLSGCGYPGEPLPPALKRPTRVVDLEAVQQGSRIWIRFTVPRATTEGIPIADTPDIDLRIGPMPAGGWSLPLWEKSSVTVPKSSVKIENRLAEASIDASGMYGKTEVIGVSVNGPRGHNVGWSNLQNVTVVPPLPAPEGLVASNAPDAVRLDWHAAAPQFRIFRRTVDSPEWMRIATSDGQSYVDTAIEYGKTYEYQVQSIEKSGDKYAESVPSKTFSFRPEDKFAPAAPAGLTAVPGSRSIELVWGRSLEKDFASYRVYRDGVRIAGGLTSPSYSDRDTKPGVKYTYQVSAVDNADNESSRSSAVETAIP